ncbi:MAG TPA: hypothetical protein ENL08_06530 [Bacteroidetes bacterium]|nr:hypothetical protein [Bacteroidota bacterium]
MNSSSFKFAIFLVVVLLATPASAQFELMWGENNPAGMNNIHGVTVNPENGDIFIVHYGDRNIRHFDDEMEHIETFNLGIGEVRGLGFDTRENRLIVANGGSFAIVDLEGEVLRTIRGAGGGINSMSYDPEEELYIVGYWNRQVAFYNGEGEQVDDFNVNVNITGICYYPINRSIFIMDTNDPVLEYSMDGEQIGTPLEGDQINGNGQDLGYDSMQRILYATGQMAWLGAFEDNYGPLPEPEFDPEGFEVAIGLGLDDEATLTIANVGEEESVLRFRLEDVGDDPDWLAIDPTTGEVAEGDDPEEITLSISTDELEPNIYNRTIVAHTNNPEFNEVEIPFELTVIAGYGELLGTVTDAATGQPVEGAVVSIPRFDFERVTDEEGN